MHVELTHIVKMTQILLKQMVQITSPNCRIDTVYRGIVPESRL